MNIIQASTRPEFDSGEMDELRALAEGGEVSFDRYLQMLMDGQEPTVQIFGGAQLR